MRFLSWLRNRVANRAAGQRTQSRAEPARFQPHLEALEDRIVPSFSSPVSIPVTAPTSVVAADLTGNGKIGLVLGGGNGVEVLMSSTNNSFKAPVYFHTNYGVNAVAVGDVNHDGKPDIVVAENPGDGASFGLQGIVSVLLGNGKGGFGPPVDFFPGALTDRVALADLNGDGLLDIVTDNSVLLNSTNQIAVMNQGGFGNGNGGAWGQTYAFGAENGLAVDDLNGDGRPDIVAMSNTNAIQVWLNNGAGGFPVAQGLDGGGSFGPVPFSDNGLAVGDVNGDGKLDLVAANGASNTIRVFAGNGNGTFGAAQNYAVPAAAYSIALGDFNQDGKLDIVTTGAQMNVLLNNVTGGFGTAQTIGPAGAGVAAADFNSDGFPDLAQIDASLKSIDILFNNADWATSGHKGHK